MRFTLNPESFIKSFLSGMSKKQESATYGLLDVIKLLTPEDTGLMVESYKVQKPNIEGMVCSVGISNSAISDSGYKYPYVVDQGAGKIYSYQKPKGSRGRYIGDGVHMFSRGIDAYKKTFLAILNQ